MLQPDEPPSVLLELSQDYCEDGTMVVRSSLTLDVRRTRMISPSSSPSSVAYEGPRYRILASLGVGGTGTVYHAHDELEDRAVALKVLQPQHPASTELASAEFRLLASHSHPNLVRVFDYGVTLESLPYFTMELLEGEDLLQFANRLRAESETPLQQQPHFQRALEQITAALDYIHTRGLVHRDLKPSNILVVRDLRGEPLVKLIDFGLAGARPTATDAHDVTELSGTIAYLAPERIAGDAYDGRSDLFSLGCILVELFTGSTPHSASSAGDTLKYRLDDAPVELDKVPRELQPGVARLLARDAGDRPLTPPEALATLFPSHAKANSSWLPAFGASLVGRARFLKQFDSILENIAQGRPSALLLRGATGSGKSRLLREMEISAQLLGYRAGIESGTGCRRQGELLQRIFRRLSIQNAQSASEANASSHSWLSHLDAIADNDAAAPDATGREARFDRLVEKLQEELLALTTDRPTVLCIDDLPSADALSRRALVSILRWLDVDERTDDADGDRRIAILLCCRDDDEADVATLREFEPAAQDLAHFAIANVEGLSATDVHHYLSQVLGLASVQNDFVEILCKETGGNICHIEEYIKQLIHSDRLQRRGRSWEFTVNPVAGTREIEVPLSVEAALSKRLARFDESSMLVLRWLAVLSTPQSADRLAELCRVSKPADENIDVTPILSDLVLDSVLQRQGSHYYFSHSAARTLVYRSMSNAVRRSYHTTIAQELLHNYRDGAVTVVENLAHHLYESDTPKESLPYLLLAAESAHRSGAYRDARMHVERALELVESSESRFHALTVAQEVSGHLGDKDFQRQTLEEMHALAVELDSKEKIRQTTLEWALYLESLGKKREALQRLQRGIDAVTDGGGLEGTLLSRSSLLHFYLSEFTAGFETLARALESARSLGQRALEAECFQVAGLGHYLQANYDQALLEMQRALAIRRELGENHQVGALESNLGLIHFDHGDLLAAEERFNASLRAFRTIGLRRGEAINLVNLGLVYSEMGRFERALDAISRSLRLRRQLGDRRGEGADSGNLAEVWIRVGRTERAVPLLDQAISLARDAENHASESANLCRLGKVEWGRDQVDTAMAHLEDSLQVARAAKVPVQEVLSELALAEAELDRGRLEVAKNLAATALKRAESGGMTLRRTECHRLLASIYRTTGELSDAKQHSEQAVELLESQRSPASGAPLVWWERYQVLEAFRPQPPGDGRPNIAHEEEAEEALRRAFVALRQISDDLEDAELRRSFLESIPVHRDINSRHETVRARTRREARRRERSFHEIAQSIHSILEIDPLLDHLLALAIETTHAEKGLILLKNPQGDFTTRAAHGMAPESVEDASDICQSVIEDVAKGRGPILATDAGTDERFRERQSIISFRIRTLMCVPMVLRDEIIGAVYVDGRGALSFDGDDLEYLVSFAQLATIAVENARLLDRLRAENLHLRREVEGRYRFENVVGDSPAMNRVLNVVAKVATTDASILLTGETGTGKEVVARALHYSSMRRSRPFVAVDCGALPGSLLESELFGHKRGAFSGAFHDRRGLFEEAGGGTLFLDEISNTSLDLQAKLLRVLQESEIRRVGENAPRKTDVRIVAATNIDLRVAVEKGDFREDLFYRLNVVTIELPALRDRREDVALLADHFLTKSRERLNHQVSGFTESGLRFLTQEPWRGNVRELENLVERAVILSESSVLNREFLRSLVSSDTRDTTMTEAATAESSRSEPESTTNRGTTVLLPAEIASRALSLHDFDQLCREAEKCYLTELVDNAGGNLSEAARQAQVRNRNTFISRLKKHGLFQPRQGTQDNDD